MRCCFDFFCDFLNKRE
ncbi:hypothetical protein Nmel_000892 [Mimus melanotis]